MYQSIHCAEYLGKFIGKLSELHHGVSGEVYAVDGRTLHIKDFTYDGQGPAAYFWIGNTRTVTSQGFRIRDENGSPMVLRRYRKEGVTITLPEKKTINNIKWFSIWCEEFEVNFGDVKIPGNFEYPRPQKINALNGVHGISSDNIVVVDAQTLLIPNLSYDGEAPDAKFWVGRGSKPSPQGIRVPNENGIEGPLMRYDRKTVVLTLPGDVTVFNIGHFGIWCEAFTVDFGHIVIPNNLNIPPSLKMLGISPQKRRQMFQFSSAEGLRPQSLVVGGNFEATTYRPPSKINHQLISQHTRLQPSTDSIPTFQTHHANHTYLSSQTALKNLFTNSFQNPDIMYQNPQIHQHQLPLHPIPYQLPSHYNSKLNCEVLYDKLAFEVRWAIAGDSIVMQLVAKLDNGEYMSFGISGDSKHSTMIGGDVVVAWIDKNTLEGFAVDYFLGHKSQCSGSKGSCPDKNITPNSDSVRLLNAATVNGYSIITYQRPLVAFDELDKSILTNLTQPIIWAIGPLNERNEVSFHSHYTKTDKFINFGRSSKWNCPIPEGEQQTIKVPSISHKNESNTTVQITTKPWHIPPIKCYEPEDGVFYAQMGPTGGKQGYPAITGRVGWGISWYINGLLIPEIYVVRGKTYTFVVEGGIDPEVPAKYHPFYITDDPVGGYEYKTPEEKKNVRIFAGTTYLRNRTAVPTGVGRLCHWTQQGDLDADNFQSFGAYQRTLELKCDQGEPGVVLWKPDKDTPDVVYYQCFTHRYLGWKIHVLDECDQQLDESKQHAVYIKPNNVNYESEIPKNTETLSQISTVNSKRAINKNAEHYTHGYIPAIPVTITSSSPTRQKNISEFQILKNVDLDLGYNVQQPLDHPTVQSLDSHVNNKLNYNDKHRHKVYKRLANQQKIFLQNKSELQLEEVDASFKATKKELTYYLPPPGRNIAPKERNLKPSNIDIAPGKVVTYDGKEISGSSLTAHENVKGFIDKTPSKTSEFLKETPQFVPYKGDLPPLNPFIDLNAPQLKGHGSLNRNLDTPLSPQTTYTKLLRVGT